jgi:hypothetical protein
MNIRVRDTVKVLESKDIAPVWHNKTGQVITIVGEMYPFCFTVKMETGHELVFKGDEIKTIKHNL